MSGFDLRFVLPIIINLLKSSSETLPWGWDAFSLFNPNVQSAWTKFCFHIILLLLFSFTSITFSLTPPPPITARIRFHFGNFSPHVALSLLCSLFFPQAPFWFMYPAILLLSHSSCWVNLRLCGAIFPVWNIQIISTLTHDHEQANTHIDVETEVPGVDHGEANIRINIESEVLGDDHEAANININMESEVPGDDHEEANIRINIESEVLGDDHEAANININMESEVPGDDHEEANIRINIESEVPVHQVSIASSPQDDTALVEG